MLASKFVGTAHPTALSDFALFVAPESEVAPQGSLQISCFAQAAKW